MLRRIARFSASLTPIVFVLIACSREVLVAETVEAGPPSFTNPDAAFTDEGNDLRSYCPSDRCPPGHTTCPNSRFICETDLRTDPNNCGECGHMCPPSRGGDQYVCVEGRCVLSCRSNAALDCDGIPDNGCETSPMNDEHCGYCGNKCPAGEPCIMSGANVFTCGCKPGEINCGGLAPCRNPAYDDANCGACGNACPPGGDGSAEARPNTYFGCWDGKCGALKCAAFFADCDGVAQNGCETSTVDDDNCGGCGSKCQDGMKCLLNELMMPTCMCPAGQTLCGESHIVLGDRSIGFGSCKDLSSDFDNCGACGVGCVRNILNASDACVYGRCDWSCNAGSGDCNGNRDDGCETNIASDPKNCGGCGIVCDGIAGQACVDGQCMVEPCDVIQDAGGPTR